MTGRARLLLLVIAVQIVIPTVALVVRWTGDGTMVRFGWQMYAGPQ